MEKIVFVGCGTAGIATAIELINNGYNGKDILMIDKGNMIDKRKCFVNENTPCKKCHVCNIVHGCGGAGSYSDSKLNFDPSARVGGDLYELFTREEIIEYLKKTYKIYQQFGIEEFKSKVYGIDHSNEALEIINKIKNNPNMELADVITIHLGTENSRVIYKRMIDFLLDNGIKIISNAELKSVDSKHKYIYYYKNGKEKVSYDKLIIAMGRAGGSFVREICEQNDVEIKNGRIEYGLRIETLNEYMKPLNDNFYEAKIYLTGKFKDKTRIFCTNPGGIVSIESYPYGNENIYLANGHSYANKKTNNTNFALLVSRSFNSDCPNPLDSYLYPLIKASSSLGKGSVICQSLKDIKLNRRSTDERIAKLDIVPTAKAYAGDLTSVVPYRTMVDILESIKELDTICKGLDGDNTLLYGLEAKFSSNRVIIDKSCKTSVDNIYCIGDCSGWCRGITSAFSMGIICAENILRK